MRHFSREAAGAKYVLLTGLEAGSGMVSRKQHVAQKNCKKCNF